MKGQFEIDLERFGEKAIRNARTIIRKIGYDIFIRIVQRTPVDTGRAKANNQIALNDLPMQSVMSFDRTGAGTISEGERNLASFDLGDTIFIYNNLVYIIRLEYGHSNQAPSGMFRLSVEEVVAHLNQSYVNRNLR